MTTSPDDSPDEPVVDEAAEPEASAASEADAPDEPVPVDESVPVDHAAMTVDGAAPVGDLASVTAERDEYLDHLRRVQAEFENYRKRVARQQSESADAATGRLVEALLPVLDACDAAIRHGAEEVDPIYASLLGTLEKEGLTRIDPSGDAFDPTVHDAVMHEPADGEADGADGPVISDVLRPGYSWKGRVLRPAMVKVRG